MTCQVQYILYTTFSKDSSLDRNLEKTWAVYLSASNDLLHSHQWCKITDWAKVDPFDHKRRTRKIYELWNLCSTNGRLWVDLCFRHQHKTQEKCKFTVSRYTNITHHNVALVSIRTVQLVVWFQVPPPSHLCMLCCLNKESKRIAGESTLALDFCSLLVRQSHWCQGLKQDGLQVQRTMKPICHLSSAELHYHPDSLSYKQPRKKEDYIHGEHTQRHSNSEQHFFFIRDNMNEEC